MQKFSLSKGFTLIELLVVIAILGILAAVVLIAINPAERIKESQDTQVRSDMSTLASAIEDCFTGEATGTYANCNTVAKLVAGNYLKSTPKTAPQPTTFDPNSAGTEVIFSAELAAASAKTKAGCVGTEKAYYTYNTTDGSSKVVCSATAPLLP